MGSSLSRNRHVLCKHVLLKEWERVVARASTHPHEARYVEESGYTALHFACYLDAPQSAVSALLAAHPAATAAREEIKGLTPLHIACYFGRDAAAGLLIDADAESIEVRTDANSTPLDLVCIRLHKQFVASSIAAANNDEGMDSALGLFVARMDRESSRYLAIATRLVEALYHQRSRSGATARGAIMEKNGGGAKTAVEEEDRIRMVHACAEMADVVPPFLLRVAMALHPEHLRQRDGGGNLPLYLALRSGLNFDCMEAIVHASPCAVMEKAGPSCFADEEETEAGANNGGRKGGLYPFMQAAAATAVPAGRRNAAPPSSSASLDVIYLLLRTCPELERFGYATNDM